MRHNNSGKKLSRNPSHRKALLRNLSKALFEYGRIRTTETKAKELRGVVESLITLAKKNDLASRRLAYADLGSHQLVKKLFDEIAPRFAGIPGGYTRVVKLAMPRPGDSAPMAIMAVVLPAPKKPLTTMNRMRSGAFSATRRVALVWPVSSCDTLAPP